MRGLIIKDILNLKKSYKTNLLVAGLFALFAYQTGDVSYIIGMVTMMMTITFITSISYDDLAKWDIYALSMPISRKRMIQSKYIFATLSSFTGVLIATAIAYLIVLPRSDMSGFELLLVAGTVFEISLLFSFTILPLIYRFGLEKVRIMMLAIFAIPSFLVFFLYKMGVSLPSEAQLILLAKLSPLLIILVLFISISISYRIFEKKDI